tara:strand:+ start:409 stop:798 length:390 start_codon:yes stop_codon:yes gene_type:complete
MPTREILMSHPVSTLRAEIAKANLSQKADKNLFKRAVSKMRKEELIAVMMAPAYKDRFHHIKMNEKGAGKPKKQPRFPAVEKAKEKKAKAEPKSSKRGKIKLVSFEPKLTATKADGTVKELKKRVKSKK